MPTYEIQAPDGNKYRIDGPAGATDDQVREQVLKQHPDAGKPKAAPVDKTKPFTLGETADIGASLVTGGVASLVGGAAKAGGYINQALGITKGDANEFGDKVADALTWSPKTERGKAVMADVAKGLQAFESWTDKQGQAWHDAVRARGDAAQKFAQEHGAPKSVVDFIGTHKESLAAGVGSVVKTTENAAPLVLGGELSKLPGRALERPAAAAAPAPAAAAPARAPGTPAAAAPLEVAPTPPRAPPSTIGAGPLPQNPTLTVRARAEAYVRDRLGLSWDALSDASKAKIERVANDAAALDRLKPEAVKRQLHLEREGFGRQPITTTAGKLNRDAPQLLREQGAAATPSGQSIRQIDIEANRTLRGNVETLIDRLKGVGKTRATAETREGVGEAVAGREAGREGALKIKERKSEQNYRRLYDTARKTEPNATVSPDPMYEFVRGNPEVLNPQIQHLSWLQGWLKKAGIEREETADAVLEGQQQAQPRRGIKLNELDDLRKKAVSIAKGGGTDAHYAGEVIKAIDQSFEEVPDAAKAWKAARDAFKTHKAEFENQGAIERLVGTKGGAYGTDPKVALEDIWKSSVKNGKLEEIRTLKRSLLSGDADTRLAGKKALRELKAETARDLLRDITKGVSTNEAGETNITAESINRWINGMGGREKLDVILGRRATNELLRIREDAQITKTEPTVRNVGSNTFQKILNWIHDSAIGEIAGKIPGGGLVKGAVVGAKNLADNVRAVSEATETATSKAEKAGAKALDTRLKREQQRGRLPVPPPTYGGQP